MRRTIAGFVRTVSGAVQGPARMTPAARAIAALERRRVCVNATQAGFIIGRAYWKSI